jgi:hypothetical protein
MNTELRQRKQAIRSFMREHYTDERLAMLLAHAQEGRLSYLSCCCFIGTTTARHPLRDGRSMILGTRLRSRFDVVRPKHYNEAQKLSGAYEAETAFLEIAYSDVARRRILIPMVRAEMRRRDRLAMSNQEVRQVPIPPELATKGSA